VFTDDDPFVGIDLDDCRNDDGRIDPVALLRIKHLATYCEVSPSGTGVKLIGRGRVPGPRRRTGNVEMYDSKRYFTMTGQLVPISPATINDCQSALDNIYRELFPATKTSKVPSSNGRSTIPNDDMILERAIGAHNGDRLLRLLEGNTTGYPSASEADISLASMLAFWAGPDPARIERLMRRSKLVRAKWGREDYLPRTIASALDGKTEFYQWKKSGKRKKDDEPGMVQLLADEICRSNHFAQDAGGRLYRYVSGVYRQRAEQYVKAQVKRLCLAWDWSKKWSTRLANETIEFIRADCPELWERPPLDVVNVQNGLLRVADRVLLPHTPKHLSPVQLPLQYDAEATCPFTEKFVSDVFPADAVDLAWEIPAWLMRPTTSIQKAVLLLGEGANGKSTWLSQIIAFLGKPNTAGVSLHKLESDKFATARLIGKLANICPDLPSEHLAGTSTFKAITGGDALDAEYKFRDSFAFTSVCRLVFSANHPPRSADASRAFFRRWLVIPFSRTFEGEAEIPREVLDAKLADPAELSGVLNKALDALERLDRNRGFSEPESVQEAWRDFHATTDPLAVWLDCHTVETPDAIVSKKALRAAYNAGADQPLTETAFGIAFRKLRPHIETARRTVNKKYQWVYVGIGLKRENPGALQGIQGIQPFPLINLSHGNEEPKRSKGGEKVSVEQSRAKVGYPGYLGHREPAPDATTCPHNDVLETPTFDGYINRQCKVCGKNLGCRKAEPQEATA